MKRNRLFISTSLRFLFAIGMLVGATQAQDYTIEQQVELAWFAPAGSFGGGVLEPGTFYGPGPGSSAVLKRSSSCLKYELQTSNLPPGAYTTWWVLVNDPENCTLPNRCWLSDVFGPNLNTASFWSTGGVVGPDGIGEFQDEFCVGDDMGFPGSLSRCLPPAPGEPSCDNEQVIGGQHLWGELTNPMGATAILIIKYHGPASEDPVVLYDQVSTLLGSCAKGANAFDDGQCFDPQVAYFVPPNTDASGRSRGARSR